MTRAPQKVASSQRVKYPFWVSYPLSPNRCVRAPLIDGPSHFYFLSWDQKPARPSEPRPSTEAENRRVQGGWPHSMRHWFARSGSQGRLWHRNAAAHSSLSTSRCMQNGVKPGHLSFPSLLFQSAPNRGCARWSHERVAVSDVAASSIWLYPCQRLLMFVYRVHNSCRLSCSSAGCECIKCVLSGSVFLFFFPPLRICLP